MSLFSLYVCLPERIHSGRFQLKVVDEELLQEILEMLYMISEKNSPGDLESPGE